MPENLRLEHLALLLLLLHSLRLWWRLNKRRVKGWWQQVKDYLPIQRHPKSPKDCLHCCQGVHLERVHINREVTLWSEVIGETHPAPPLDVYGPVDGLGEAR